MLAGIRRARPAAVSVALLMAARVAAAQDLPRGSVIDTVTCLDDATERYALYLPSDYSPDRVWNLLLAFHPAARGQVFVEKYRAAAERYGYIVAGSNNSRNGSWAATIKAVRAMSKDVGRRFAVDAERIYLTGHSGGARVAMEVALGPNEIAGVIASSAGFPDAKPRTSVKFAVFATAGIDDFNYLEMKRLDARLTSPHHLALFDGGHAIPPDAIALEAIEWLELQAMRSGRRTRDARLIDRFAAGRRRRIDAAADALNRLRLLESSVADFSGLADVADLARERDTLAKDPDVRRRVARERADLDAEARLLDAALVAESRLRDQGTRAAALAALRTMFEGWSRAAAAPQAGPERSQARRLLGAVASGVGDRTRDEEYRALVQQYRWRAPDRP